MGIWLLVPELLRLGAWDIIKGWTGKEDVDLDPRIAMQVVNESALCINRVRRKNSLGHQGFELANGMGRLAADEQVHLLLDKHTTNQAQAMLMNLGIQRQLSGHYQGDIIAIDPHRIISTSQREMPKKQKKPNSAAQKMLQTFFCVSAQTGQPIMATMSSTGMPTSKATSILINETGKIIRSPSLLVADKEHFTRELLSVDERHEGYDLLVPVKKTRRVLSVIEALTYKRLWAGFAIAETIFSFNREEKQYRLIAERHGEVESDYTFKAFITTSKRDAKKLVCEDYDKRWSVEEFFRFENEMGIKRASTHNLNIRYGKLALAMIAQGATYQLRRKMPAPYKNWDAKHLSTDILAWSDGDVRVKGDTIIVTFYGKSNHINKRDYVNLPEILKRENIDPKIPWLYGFKLDFRFK
ncbi:MAG: transposase [Bacteroidales bacterium]|nr:transposase [Bacteroidales bacterium]